jgi:hypothetical protein
MIPTGKIKSQKQKELNAALSFFSCIVQRSWFSERDHSIIFELFKTFFERWF